ncbi:Hypothetical protein PBC10988_12670 [Planctomycetales bacterium 10988]|nr:Hypothetical protein PBC10988_12670 [Planctomycetales bacterium 10988]
MFATPFNPRPISMVGALPFIVCVVWFSTTSAFAQSEPPENPETTVLEYHWSNGNLMERKEVYEDAEGQKINHGEYRFFHLNGKLREEVRYVHGDRQGEAKMYHENGKLASTTNFKDDKQEGTEVLFDPEGVKFATFQYQNDLPHGKWTWYYPDGQPTQEITYHEGVEEGPWQWWYPSGQLGIQGTYHQDEQHGNWKYWNKKGELQETREYDLGILQTPPKYLPKLESEEKSLPQ